MCDLCCFRSVLTVIQEKQDKQERDMGILKDEIAKIRHDVALNKEVISAVKALVGDNAWATNNLKMEQNELRKDFEAAKLVQEEQNATHIEMQRQAARAEEDRERHHDGIRVLQHEVAHMRGTVRENKKAVNEIASALKLNVNRLRLPRRKPNGEDDRRENLIPMAWTSSTEDDVTEDVTEPPNRQEAARRQTWQPEFVDRIVSALEEQKNVVDNNLAEMLRNEDELKKEMGGFAQKFLLFEAELSKIYAMFFNLSLQQSNLENKMLLHQQQRFDHDIRDLQQSFMNFTQHVFGLEQFHISSGNHFNTSTQNRREINEMNAFIHNHSSRIHDLVELLSEYKASTVQNFTHIVTNTNQINDTMHEFIATFSVHNSRAKNIFEDVHERFVELEGKTQKNDDRLAHVEVKVLNATLQQCQKSNQDHVQDKKLSDFNTGVAKLDAAVSGHENQITR